MSETVGGVTTKFLVDDLNPTGYSQVVDELVNGAVTRTYAYGLNRISENQLINGTWTPSFYGYDGHGNVRFLANATGAVTDTYDYDAFGNQIASTGTTPNNLLYSGEEFDLSTGLYYLRARYYRDATGRFLTMDPYGGCVQDCGTLHKYVYAENNPVNRIDPTGRAALFENVLIRGGSLQGPIEATIARAFTPYVIKTAVCTAYYLTWALITPYGTNVPAPWNCWEWANGF